MRVRAYELFLEGNSKSAISRLLNISRPTVTVWSKQDEWEKRASTAGARAEQKLEDARTDSLTAALTRLRQGLKARLDTLERLCSGAEIPPAAQLGAIKLWFELSRRGQTADPLKPGTAPGNLELVEDLAGLKTGEGSTDEPPEPVPDWALPGYEGRVPRVRARAGRAERPSGPSDDEILEIDDDVGVPGSALESAAGESS